MTLLENDGEFKTQ
ncbi:hypothetical protein CSUI_005947, partial [Cystoisospora suis]